MAKSKGKSGKKKKANSKPKRPYTVSDKVRQANVENSKRSCGPKGSDAKKRVGQNSRKLGLTCLEAVIDGEDPKELQALGDLFAASQGAETPVEDYLTRLAAQAAVRLQRTIAANASTLNSQMAAVRRGTREKERRRIARLVARLRTSPTEVVTKLRESAAGCSYLIDEWTHIQGRLHCCNSVLRSEREHAVLLLGRPLNQPFDHAATEEWNLAFLASIPLPDGKQPDLKHAHEVFDGDRPLTMTTIEFDVQLSHWVKCLPSRQEAVARLKLTVERTLAELTMHRKALIEIEAEQLANDIVGAKVDRTIEGARVLRHEQAYKNEMAAMLKLARSMRESRLAGVFQETVEIGFSERLRDLLAASGSEESSDRAHEIVSPTPNPQAPTPDFQANPAVESQAEFELQSKPDCGPPAIEANCEPGQEVTTEEKAPLKPDSSCAAAPIPAPRPARPGEPGPLPFRSSPGGPHPTRGHEPPFRTPNPQLRAPNPQLPSANPPLSGEWGEGSGHRRPDPELRTPKLEPPLPTPHSPPPTHPAGGDYNPRDG